MLGVEPLHLDLSSSTGCGTLTRVTTGHRVLSLPSITASYQDSFVLSDVDVALSLHLVVVLFHRVPARRLVSPGYRQMRPGYRQISSF